MRTFIADRRDTKKLVMLFNGHVQVQTGSGQLAIVREKKRTLILYTVPPVESSPVRG